MAQLALLILCAYPFKSLNHFFKRTIEFIYERFVVYVYICLFIIRVLLFPENIVQLPVKHRKCIPAHDSHYLSAIQSHLRY